MKRKAIVIGHQEKGARGAILYNKETEFSLNKKVALEIAAILPAEEVEVFQRIPGPYREACLNIANRCRGFDMVIELHCNSFCRPMQGAEILLLHDASYEAHRKARWFLKNFVGETGFSDRGVKQVRQSDRGYTNLMEYRKAQIPFAAIWEPTFCNFENNESKFVVEDWKKYAAALVNCLRSMNYN